LNIACNNILLYQECQIVIFLICELGSTSPSWGLGKRRENFPKMGFGKEEGLLPQAGAWERGGLTSPSWGLGKRKVLRQTLMQVGLYTKNSL